MFFHGLRVADELRLIQHLVHLFHDLIADLHTDTDIHSAGGVSDVVFRAELFQPVCAAASGADDHLVRVHRQQAVAILQQHALAAFLFQNDVLAFGIEAHLHAVIRQIVLDGQIQLLCLLGTQMADGAVHQLQTRMDGVLDFSA